MSTAYVSWPLLSLFLVSSLAGRPSTALSDPRIAQTLPACAQACVQATIVKDFITSCFPLDDIECLCRRDSASGFTLGETSLRCVASQCSEINDATTLGRVYGICQDISNAKPMTHSTLTATDFVVMTLSSPAPTRTTSLHDSSSTSHQSSASTVTSVLRTQTSASSPSPMSKLTSYTSITASIITTSSSSHSFTSPSSNVPSSADARVSSTSYVSTPPSATSLSALGTPDPVLTRPQIVGISIAGVAATAAIIGAIFFLFCFRRRRPNKRDSSSTFGGDRIIPSHPGSPASYHPISADSGQGYGSRDLDHLESQDGPILPYRTDEGPKNSWSRSEPPGGLHVVMDPGMQQYFAVNESPLSFKSTRTNSGLLPDKPTYSLYPAPLRINHSVSPESPVGGAVPGAAGIGHKGATPLSKAAPQGRKTSNTSQISLQRNFSTLRGSASDPFLDSRSDPSASPYARQMSQNPRSRLPDKNWPMNPDLLNHGQWTQSLTNLPQPVPARQSSSARTLNRQKAQYASISPSDYTGRPMFDFSIPPPPPEPLSISRKPIYRRSAPRRPAVYSSASETSFEDAGDEEGLPTTHFILSPLTESPAVQAARAQIGHPQVPGLIHSQYVRRPEPESPTRKPARRKQPPPPITSTSVPRPLKSSLKPLPKVPEHFDSSTPLLSSQHGDTIPTPTLSEARSSPRGEMELTKTAKWKILVSPGLQGIENLGTPRSGRSSEWTPNTPTRRDLR